MLVQRGEVTLHQVPGLLFPAKGCQTSTMIIMLKGK